MGAGIYLTFVVDVSEKMVSLSPNQDQEQSGYSVTVPSGCSSRGTSVGSRVSACVDHGSVPVWQFLYFMVL